MVVVMTSEDFISSAVNTMTERVVVMTCEEDL